MKVLVLGNNSLSKTLAQNGFQVTTDPGDKVSVIVSDAASFKFAPEGPLFIFLTGSICDWAAKQAKPDAIFISSEKELFVKLQALVPSVQKIKEIECPKDSLLLLTHANKGGVGKTSSAISLAVTIADLGISTAICDCDFAGPDVGSFFGIKPTSNWLETNPVLTKASENLMVLPGPKNIDIPSIKGYQVVNVVQNLKEKYQVIVCDTCPAPWEKAYMHGLFANADLVYSVVDQSLFSIDETAKYAPSLLAMGVTPEKIRIIVNRYNAKLTSIKQIDKAFCSGFRKEIRTLPKIAGVIPEGWEEQVNASFKGKVLHQDEWKKTCQEIVQLLGGNAHVTMKSPELHNQSFLKRLFSRKVI